MDFVRVLAEQGPSVHLTMKSCIWKLEVATQSSDFEQHVCRDMQLENSGGMAFYNFAALKHMSSYM